MSKDTIYRQDAIDAISCNITVTGRRNAEVVAETIGAFADRIKALPSVQPEQRWIPVTERLPEDYEKVLVTVEDGEIVFGFHLGKYWAYGARVIAWMPLPEPYKERRER